MEDFDFIIGLIRNYGYFIIGFGVFIEAMGIPSPGETVLVLGGVAASLNHLNIFYVILVSALGAILGDNAGYYLGQRFGMKLIKRLEHIHLFREENVEKIKKFFKDHGHKTVFLGRFTAILRTYVALFAGIFHMPYSTFFIYNLTGGIVWSIVFGLLGYFVGSNLSLLQTILVDFTNTGLLAIGLLVIFLLVRHFYKKHFKST